MEEAVCLHMHLANQRGHLDRLICEARDLVAVSLMHYHTEQQTTGGACPAGSRTPRNSTIGGITQWEGS